jgi:hypothetical protein
MLKAVENPSGDQLSQGIMVTPEGGYVVAQPDMCAVFFSENSCSKHPLQRIVAETSSAAKGANGGRSS